MHTGFELQRKGKPLRFHHENPREAIFKGWVVAEKKHSEQFRDATFESRTPKSGNVD